MPHLSPPKPFPPNCVFPANLFGTTGVALPIAFEKARAAPVNAAFCTAPVPLPVPVSILVPPVFIFRSELVLGLWFIIRCGEDVVVLEFECKVEVEADADADADADAEFPGADVDALSECVFFVPVVSGRVIFPGVVLPVLPSECASAIVPVTANYPLISSPILRNAIQHRARAHPSFVKRATQRIEMSRSWGRILWFQ